MTSDFAASADRSAEHHASVLFVDDDVLTLATVQEALENAGFQVVIAESGDEALRILDEQRVDALVTSVRLKSGEEGWDIAHRARMLRPAVPVVYVSGGEGDYAERGVGGSQLIRAPFDPQAIVEAVSGLLGCRLDGAG